jgi:hypothetical protein
MAQYSGINFLRERVRLQEAVVVQDKRIAFITSIALGGFIAVLISIVGYRAFLSRQLSKLQEAGETETNNLRALGNIQSQIEQRNTKLATVQSILEKRGKKWDAITYFYRELPTTTTISAVNLSSLDGTLNFIVTSPDVFAFEELSKKLQSQEVKNSGYQVHLGTLTRARTGIYELTVKLALSASPIPKKAVPRAQEEPQI